MDGPHDLGGRYGFGPVRRSVSEPVFKAEWERKAFGLTFAGLGHGIFNIDENRYARERMAPRDYLGCSYYELWLAGLEANLLDAGVITPAQLEARTRQYREGTAVPLPQRSMPEFVAGMRAAIFAGLSPAREVDHAPRYAVGERVRTRIAHPRGHTRLPAYARGRPATIARVLKAYVFPDSNAHRLGEAAQYVYSLRLQARDLWGEDADPNMSLNMDVWESYIEPAD